MLKLKQKLEINQNYEEKSWNFKINVKYSENKS